MDEATRRRVCELIAGIIATDDHLDPNELQFMLKTFQTFGIATGPDDEAVCPTSHPREAAEAMRALPESVREEALELLIQSAAADGRVVPAERVYLDAVASAAGVPPETLDARIQQALDAQRA